MVSLTPTRACSSAIIAGGFTPPPEELDFFKGKLLLAVQIGEFYYLQEEWGKCYRVRRHIYDGKYGRLDRQQQAIMLYRLADVKVWLDEDQRAGIPVLEPFAKGEFKGTYIYPIALYGLATLEGQFMDEKDAMLKTIGYCQEALKHVKDTRGDLADKLKYFIAGRYHYSLYNVFGDKDALRKANTLYAEIAKNEKSKWRKLCLEKLALINDEKAKW